MLTRLRVTHRGRGRRSVSVLLLASAILAGLGLTLLSPLAQATSNYAYKPDEYVVITGGLSPDGQYSIATHGEGELGYGNFHVYLMKAKTGKKIGPLEEIKDNLDTGADAFRAQWSADSRQVLIRYRIDRHVTVAIRYGIEKGHAYRISGPTKN